MSGRRKYLFGGARSGEEKLREDNRGNS